MRWFLGLVLVVALATGALYGVGRFLLPNSLSVTKTITIQRPRAEVFAMSNDLRIAKEWSPLYALDPDADFTFSGEGPGAGQTMRWVSNNRDVGKGSLSIVSSNENQQIQGIFERADSNATLNSQMDFKPAGHNTTVTWTITGECGDGWINVPCRYMNLVLRGRIDALLADGLRRLKEKVEKLPNIDFEGYDIGKVTVVPQNVFFVDCNIGNATPTFDDRVQAQQDGIDKLNAFVSSTQGVSVTGDTVRVFPPGSNVPGTYSFSVGYPFVGAPPAHFSGVRVGQTPGGDAVRAMYVGPRSQIGVMYERMDAFMKAHGITPRAGADAWEIVRSVEPPAPNAANPNDPVEHTEIYYPIG
jgi:hypothetical protein